jgi:hypothetical protein
VPGNPVRLMLFPAQSLSCGQRVCKTATAERLVAMYNRMLPVVYDRFSMPWRLVCSRTCACRMLAWRGQLHTTVEPMP